jgi:hypothetical protein
LECTIFLGVVEIDEEEFCCRDEASAAGSPMDLIEKEERRRKAEENTVAVMYLYRVLNSWRGRLGEV